MTYYLQFYVIYIYVSINVSIYISWTLRSYVCANMHYNNCLRRRGFTWWFFFYEHPVSLSLSIHTYIYISYIFIYYMSRCCNESFSLFFANISRFFLHNNRLFLSQYFLSLSIFLRQFWLTKMDEGKRDERIWSFNRI